jgi:hypothetical protein
MLDPKPYKRPHMSVIRGAVKKIDKALSASGTTALKSGVSRRRMVAISEVESAFTPMESSQVTTPRHESQSAICRAKSILVSKVLSSFRVAAPSESGGNITHGLRLPGASIATSIALPDGLCDSTAGQYRGHDATNIGEDMVPSPTSVATTAAGGQRTFSVTPMAPSPPGEGPSRTSGSLRNRILGLGPPSALSTTAKFDKDEAW